ncbi:hsp90-like protein [Ophiostoma piceae UAMH 11346]|uniref:Hsp90-like protein n=1 Tax=Ophiostoma piceae (strain UAMH 11346) TaxID=1262450 RepID=S3D9C2_OPHP1|nr:hsp90-like protein [Ophiostoma piceae UAMH 11346]
MHLESEVYATPRDHTHPSATRGPTTAPARNTSSDSLNPGFSRRPHSAVVTPVTASFAPVLDHPVSPTSSSTSSLFSSAPTLSSVSATHQPASSWITSDPCRNVLASASFLQGLTVAVGESAFSNEPSGGYFGAGAGFGVGVGVGVSSSSSGGIAGSGSDKSAASLHATSNIPGGSFTYSESTGGEKALSRSTSSASTTFSSRRASKDSRPPELSDLAPFSTVFSLSTPSSPASISHPDSSLSPSHPLFQDLSSLRRPPYNRSSGSSDYHATPRSYIVKPSDFNPYSDNYNTSYIDNNLSSDTLWSPSAMIGNIHGEPGSEYVRRQFLPRGSVVKQPLLDGSNATVVEGSANTVTSPPASSTFPLPDSDFVELLNQDDRPTFIVDTAYVASHTSGPLCVAFANTALKERPLVLDQIANTSDDLAKAGPDYALFKSWVLNLDSQEPGLGMTIDSSQNGQDSQDDQATPTASGNSTIEHLLTPSPPSFAGWHWAASTIRQHYRVIRGVREDSNPSTPSEASSAPLPETTKTSVTNASESIQVDDKTPKSAPAPESVVLPQDIAGDNITIIDEKSSFDWTRIAITHGMPPHIEFARSVDWASTPLGPIENWSSDLRLMSNLIMASPHPAAMYWGPNYTAIYNEAYTEMAGQKHPRLMGSNYPDSWAEIWGAIEPFFQSAWNAGQAVLKQDNRLFIKRNGFLEETFFNWSLVPLVGSDGSVVGLYNPAFENTRRKVNERRMLLLNEVGERTAKARTIPEFWDAAGSGLDSNEYDVPFALLYSVVGNNGSEDEDNSDTTSTLSSSAPSSLQVILEGSIGVPEGHRAAVSLLDINTAEEGFAPYMRQAIAQYREAASFPASPLPIVLSKEDGTLPAELMVGLDSDRGFGDPCRTVVIIPVLNPSTASTSAGTMADLNINGNSSQNLSPHKSLYGFLVMGTNPRRPYNGDYRLFVHLLARQLTTSLASVMLFSEEVRRHQHEARKAAQDRHELSQELVLRTRQAMESENKFMRMAEFTPVGMFVTDNTGKISYCNDMWWEISRHPKVDLDSEAGPTFASTESPMPADIIDPSSTLPWATWMDSVQDEDQPALMVVWDRLVRDKMAITHEFRFKQNTTIHTDGTDPIETTTWVLLRAYPEKDEDGNLKGIFGCITDISQQKLAEEFQIQLRKEAVEHKRQQENFIDITSHEMRNPLSAILQTVDEITSSISDLRATIKSGKEPDYNSVLDNILEASNTISLCSNHQKRIVEDVLTLSKLDSRLLPVTPVDVQPVMVIRSTLKMFESELIAHDIHCVFRVQPSYESLVGFSNWVKLDPSRLNQILINLLTNAIKFTQSSGERSITISLGASDGDSDPAKCDVASSIAELSYVPSRQDKPELAIGPDWGEGQLVNIHVAVSDTGQGLLEEEKSVLFQHFTQSFPRTHVQYGGSGLGLYICRNLAELQGGQISVTSEKDLGSTFAFYVKCRKVSSTPTGVEPGSSNLSSIVTGSLPTNPSSVIAYTSDGSRDGIGSCHCISKSKNFDTPTLLPQLPSPPVLIETPLSTPNEMPSQPFLSLGASSSAAAVTVTSAPAESSSEHADVVKAAVEEAMPPFDVLIVEDNLVNQRVLQRQLDKSGNRTIVANHGGEALDILRQSTYWRATDEQGSRSSSIAEIGSSPRPYPPALGVDSASSLELNEPPPRSNISVVLMDLEMPVMDGMTCARAIRALERSGTLLRHVPIIAVTAYARQEQIDGAKAAGIPFRLTQLMPKIQELVAKYNTNPVALGPLGP